MIVQRKDERARDACRHFVACWKPLADLAGLFGLSWERPESKQKYQLPSSAPVASSGSRSGRIDVLTGVRALALLWVLAFHTAFLGAASDLVFPEGKSMPVSPALAAQWINQWITQPIVNGDMGVDVFFTLSGILITTMWLRETIKKGGGFNYLRFIVRRYLRLAPMLVVGIMFQLLFGLAAGHFEEKAHVCSKDWWKLLLMINNYYRTPGNAGCLIQAWSVAVEFQLYLLAPLLLFAVWDQKADQPRRLWWLRMFAAWCTQPILRVVVVNEVTGWHTESWFLTFNRWGLADLPLSYTAMFTRSAPFVAGMTAALAVHRIKQLRKQQQLQQMSNTAAAEGLQLCTIKGTQQQKKNGLTGTLVGTAAADTATETDIPAAADQLCGVKKYEGPGDTTGAAATAAGKILHSGPGSSISRSKSSAVAAGHGSECSRPTPMSSTDARCIVLEDNISESNSAGGSPPAASGAARLGASLAQTAQRTWHLNSFWMLACIDLVAVTTCIVLIFLGGSENRHTANILGPAGDIFICIFGRALFGAALAHVLAAVLLGRLKPLGWLLAWNVWLPIAGLSYGAYLLQDLPLVVLYNWTVAGATTLFAGWAVFWFEFVYFTVLCLALALPFFCLVEMPFQRLVKRGY